ncbi:unnamed protein product [Peniophora sp. CBMAI 1063]|nr:unnamed protein product [Peniophora sp. CBMAI 1063]
MSRIRSFVSRHGRRYTWTPARKCLELVRDDDTVVLRSSSGSSSLFGKRRPPHVTIFETCFDDVDEIILTYIYIQRMEELSPPTYVPFLILGFYVLSFGFSPGRMNYHRGDPHLLQALSSP